MKRITNLSGGQLVNTLKDGTTLRIDHKHHEDISDANLTPYLETIEKKGLVKIETVGGSVTTPTPAVKVAVKSVEEVKS